MKKCKQKIKFVTILLIIIIFTILFNGCRKKLTEETHIFDINMKIVSINGETKLSSDKFHIPQYCNNILFVTLTEPKQYRQLNTCKIPFDGNSIVHFHINNDEWIYNHKPGDIVHFDYLLKSKFFTIDENHKIEE